jgi:hypothetical protein
MTMRKAAALGLFVLGMFGHTEIGAADDRTAQLVRPVPTRTNTDIDGIMWACTGDQCVGTPVGRKKGGSRMDECRKVAAVLGKVVSFSSRGKPLDKEDLESCNRAAR